MPESPLTYLYFDEYGMYFEHVQGCEFCAEDGRYTAYFYIAKEVTPYPVEVDQAWVDTLTAIIAEYNMMAWNGFTKRDSRLLDGTSFRTEFSFADGTHVQASGYGAFPSGYAGASAAIDAHFMQLLPEDMHDW